MLLGYARVSTDDQDLALQRRALREAGCLGRPPALAPDQVALGRRLVEEGQTVREVAKLLKVHRATLYRELAKATASPA